MSEQNKLDRRQFIGAAVMTMELHKLAGSLMCQRQPTSGDCRLLRSAL